MKVKQMKYKIAVSAMAVFAASLFFGSCEFEASENGDLDGFWHLERIDTLANGNSADLSRLHIFWGIEHHLISARQSDFNKESMYFRFEQTRDSLMVTKVYLDHGHQDNGPIGGDIPLNKVSADLRYYGVNNIPEGFAKEALDGSKMILRSKTLRLQFRKF